MKDNVNHPEHYKNGGIETIDVIKAWTEGLDGIQATDTGNIIKYISRWKKKNGLEDLKKAQWYLNHLIKEVEASEFPAMNPPETIDGDEYVLEDFFHDPKTNEIFGYFKFNGKYACLPIKPLGNDIFAVRAYGTDLEERLHFICNNCEMLTDLHNKIFN